MPLNENSAATLGGADHSLMVLSANLVGLELENHKIFGVRNVFGDSNHIQLEVDTLVHDDIFHCLTLGTLSLDVEVVSGQNLMCLHELELAGNAGLQKLLEEPIVLYSAQNVWIEHIVEVFVLFRPLGFDRYRFELKRLIIIGFFAQI